MMDDKTEEGEEDDKGEERGKERDYLLHTQWRSRSQPHLNMDFLSPRLPYYSRRTEIFLSRLEVAYIENQEKHGCWGGWYLEPNKWVFSQKVQVILLSIWMNRKSLRFSVCFLRSAWRYWGQNHDVKKLFWLSEKITIREIVVGPEFLSISCVCI